MEEREESNVKILNRRSLLFGSGAIGLSTLFARPALAAATPPADFDPALIPPWAPVLRRTCQATPSNIPGPYYVDLDLLRSDITEGKPGFPMTLVFQVVRASDCRPIPGAVVDVWHNDAAGDYSGFANQGTAGQTWLRGVQAADARGLVFFQTIYPGWYPGRTTHVHVKVFPTPTSELTTQFFFEDFLSNAIYLQVPPYDQRGPNPTDNARDNFFTPETVLRWTPNPDGTQGIYAGLRIAMR